MRKLLLAGLLMTAPLHAQVPQINIAAEAPVIGVAVTDSIESRPDLALFDVGVSTTAPTATAAIAENARKMETVIRRIRAAGVADRDIQTTGISLYPQHNHQRIPDAMPPAPPQIIGYVAGNNVRIRYRRLNELGALIDALVAAGATNINGPMFTIEDPAGRVRQARELALTQAEQRANEYARRVGARSVRLLSITEGAQGRNYGNDIVVTGRMASMDVAAAPPPPSPVEPGQISTSMSLFVQYALER
jgi:uncharacterized protein